MRVVALMALLLCGCRQLLSLDDIPVDGSLQHHVDAMQMVDVITPLPDDRDADGVADEVDNCPDKPNPNQGNEDGDKFGDVCDPCPIDMNDTPNDPDGDGVADICDPHPNAAGDKIAVFEGFKSGVPSTWQSIGTVTNGTGDVTLVQVANNHSAVVPPIGPLGNGTISASIIVDSVDPNGSSSSITMPYNATTDDGIFCELDEDPAGNPKRFLGIYDTHANNGMGVGISSNNFTWSNGVVNKLVFTRNGSNYSCSVTPAGGGTRTTNGSSNNGGNLGAAQAAVAMYNSGAHLQWMMVVTSP